MTVCRNLGDGQRHFLHTAGLGKRERVAEMKRNAATKVGKRERRLSIAAVGRADQIEQGLVLGNREQLALAEHPSRGGKVASKHSDFSNVGLCHIFVLLFSSGLGRCPAERSRN